MDGAGGVDLHVDRKELERIQGELEGMVAGLCGLFMRADADGREMGGDDVAGAVEEFAGSWTLARERLVGRLEACAEHVRIAVVSYSDTECGLVDAAGRGLQVNPAVRQ
jgi:hypothetical protein